MTRVLSVTDVVCTWVGTPNPVPIVTAIGTVGGGGWTKPRLTSWVYITPPSDGFLDVDFTAEPPTGPSIKPLLPIHASRLFSSDLGNFWGSGLPLNGIRVHSTSNSHEMAFQASDDVAPIAAAGDDNPYPLLAQLALRLGDADFFVEGDARRPFSNELEKLMVGRLVRFLRTGDGFTTDWVPERINIELDPATKRAVRVWEG